MAGTRLFQFEADILEEIIKKERKKFSDQSKEIRELGSSGSVSSVIGEDNNPLHQKLVDNNEGTYKRIKAYELRVQNSRIIDSEIDLNQPVEYAQEGAYVVLESEFGIEKYVLGHFNMEDLRLMGINGPLGGILVEAKAGIDHVVRFNDIKYKVLELSWGFPVITLERTIVKEYRELDSRFEYAIRTQSEAEEIFKEITTRIIEAETQMTWLAKEFGGIAVSITDKRLVEPFEYIFASRKKRINIRDSTPSQLIHYHRMVDAYSKHSDRLRKLLRV